MSWFFCQTIQLGTTTQTNQMDNVYYVCFVCSEHAMYTHTHTPAYIRNAHIHSGR